MDNLVKLMELLQGMSFTELGLVLRFAEFLANETGPQMKGG